MSDELRSIDDIEAELQNANDVVDEENIDEGSSEISQAAQDSANYEAGRKGWVPKAQYKKNPDTWVDAQTFLERGDRFVVNLQRDVERLTKKLEDFEGTKAAFVKFTDEALAQKDEQLKDAISALRVQRTQAIREGEDDLAVQLEDRIDLLRDQRKEVKKLPEAVAAKPGPQEQDPVLQEWILEDNAWFNDEPKLRDFAIKVGENMIADGETVRGRRFLDKIRVVMEQEFPRRFAKKETNTRAGAESSNASSGNKTGGVAGRTERDLPSEDRSLMKQFVESGLMTKEAFLKSYFSRN